MNKIEELLNEEKLKIKQINVPEDLESRLRDRVNNHQSRKPKKSRWVATVAVILLLATTISFNFDTLAYYGKKIIGYDEVMNGTLKNLNELGKGQLIDETYTFENGVIFTLDGIMLDDNQLLVFYTITDPNGNVDEFIGNNINIQGRFHEIFMNSSTGSINEDNTEMKNVTSFETPYFFEKLLSVTYIFIENGVQNNGKIQFDLDRKKAMGHTLKENINQSIEIGKNKIKFETIQASATSTVIEGKIQSILDLVLDHIRGERIGKVNTDLVLELIANGVDVEWQSKGTGTNSNGVTFEYEFAALPTDLDKLQIKLVSFETDHAVDKNYKLNKKLIDQTIEVLNQNILINKIYEKNGDTFVTFTTEESVILTEVNLIIDGSHSDFVETIEGDYIKTEEGKILHTRTMHFSEVGNKIELDINRIQYKELFNEIIDIPVD